MLKRFINGSRTSTIEALASTMAIWIGSLTLVLHTANAEADQVASCSINISGDLKGTVNGKAVPLPPNPSYQQTVDAKRVAAGTDYWMTDAQIREQHKVLAAIGKMKTPSPAEVETIVAEKMKRDPKLMLLEMTCGDKEWSLVFSPARNSKYADIPFKPNRYVIAPVDVAKPGQFVVAITHKNADTYRVRAPGTLEIEKFDSTGITAKFSFDARKAYTEETVNINLAGTMQYSCIGDKCAK